MTHTLFPREGILEGTADSLGLLSDGEDAVFMPALPGMFIGESTDIYPPREMNRTVLKVDGPFEEVDMDDLTPIAPIDPLPEDDDIQPEEIHGLEDGPSVPAAPEDPEPSPGGGGGDHPDTSPGSGGVDPPEPPITGAPPLDPDSGDEPDDADSGTQDSPSADPRLDYPAYLTDSPHSYSGMEEPEASDDDPGLLERLVSGVRDLIQSVFHRNGEEDRGSGPVPEIRPEAGSDTLGVLDPDRDFSAGYISQRDLENALGRESWTMCCATSFVYATQTKYPDLDAQAIYRAAGKAAETELSAGDGKCVGDDGYVGEIWNYSQSLARELGLKEYVDTPERFDTVKEAQDAGYDMMKIRYEGTIDDKAAEHHVLQVGDTVVDPIPGGGMEDVFDKGSAHITQVMALDWYKLPKQANDEVPDS